MAARNRLVETIAQNVSRSKYIYIYIERERELSERE